MDQQWIFIPGKDSSGNDLEFNPAFDLKNIPKECVAVNTLGFIKSKIVFPLENSPYYKSDLDGLYIKRDAFPASISSIIQDWVYTSLPSTDDWISNEREYFIE